MNGRSVSVTGATGFLGLRLVRALANAGWRVRAVVRPGSVKPLPPGVERVIAPLEAGPLERALADAEVVIHAAGLTRAPSAPAFDRVNVEGTRAVVEATNAVSARLVFVSSQAAAGTGTPGTPRRESHEPRPLTAYGCSKRSAEIVVQSAARTHWTILRPSSVYGPGDRAFLPIFRLAARGVFVPVTDPAAFTLTYVDDVVRAIMMASLDDRAHGETLFVGHPQPETMGAVLRTLSEIYAKPYGPRRLPRGLLRAASLMGDLWWKLGGRPLVDSSRFTEFTSEGFVCDVGRVRDVLGFVADVDARDGLSRTARWYREQGWVRSR